nr:hypothetical protein [Angustibacter aerolatus]
MVIRGHGAVGAPDVVPAADFQPLSTEQAAEAARRRPARDHRQRPGHAAGRRDDRRRGAPARRCDGGRGAHRRRRPRGGRGARQPRQPPAAAARLPEAGLAVGRRPARERHADEPRHPARPALRPGAHARRGSALAGVGAADPRRHAHRRAHPGSAGARRVRPDRLRRRLARRTGRRGRPRRRPDRRGAGRRAAADGRGVRPDRHGAVALGRDVRPAALVAGDVRHSRPRARFGRAVARAVAVALHPEDRLDRSLADHVGAEPEGLTEALRLRRPDGRRREVVAWAQCTLVDGVVTSVFGATVDVTSQRAAERQVAHMAASDGLTGLPNRTVLDEPDPPGARRAARADGRPARRAAGRRRPGPVHRAAAARPRPVQAW